MPLHYVTLAAVYHFSDLSSPERGMAFYTVYTKTALPNQSKSINVVHQGSNCIQGSNCSITPTLHP